MTAFRTPTSVALLLPLALAACGGTDSGTTVPSPRLTLVDSIVLEQNDSAYLASPAAMVADDHGYWVADAQQATLLRYDREGRYERRIGRQGRGPGEFASPWRLAHRDDGQLLVLDLGSGSVVGVNSQDGAHDFRHPVGGMFFGTSMFPRGDSLLLGGLGMTPPLGGVWLDLASGEVTTAVPAPEGTERVLLSNFEFAAVVELQDGILAMWPGLRDARLRGWDGSDVDVQIPAITRPVPPQDMLDGLKSGRLDSGVAWSLISLPWASGVLAAGDGAFATLTFAPLSLEEGVSVTGGHLSVISGAADRACVDAPITFHSDERPVVSFRGDTLQLLEQVVQGSESLAVLRTYAISTEGCDWLPTDKQEVTR